MRLDQYDISVCLGWVSGYHRCPLEGFDYITGSDSLSRHNTSTQLKPPYIKYVFSVRLYKSASYFNHFETGYYYWSFDCNYCMKSEKSSVFYVWCKQTVTCRNLISPLPSSLYF